MASELTKMASEFLKRSSLFVRSYSKVNGGNGNRVFKIGNGNGGMERGTKNRQTTVIELIKNVYYFAFNAKYGPKPMVTYGSSEEIQFEIPAPGLKTNDIKMMVDVNNRFILVGQNSQKHYMEHLDLPKNANFEKALFKATLEDGMVEVTVTNFERGEVEVKLEE